MNPPCVPQTPRNPLEDPRTEEITAPTACNVPGQISINDDEEIFCPHCCRLHKISMKICPNTDKVI